VQEPDVRREAVRLHARSAAGGGAEAGLSGAMAGRTQSRWAPASAGMTMRGLLGAFALCLVACTQTPAPVTFHADGYPEKLGDWHVVYRDGDALALNDRVVPFDL